MTLLLGCASAEKQAETSTVATKPVLTQAQLLEQDMVADLLNVLPQLLNPLNTTVQVNDTHSKIGYETLALLDKLGYGIQRVDSDQGAHFLRLDTDYGGSVTDQGVLVSIGSLELSRSYRVINKSESFGEGTGLVWRGSKGVIATSPLALAGSNKALTLSGVQTSSTSSDDLALSEGKVIFTELTPIPGGVPPVSSLSNFSVQKPSSEEYSAIDSDSFKSVDTPTFPSRDVVIEHGRRAVK